MLGDARTPFACSMGQCEHAHAQGAGQVPEQLGRGPAAWRDQRAGDDEEAVADPGSEWTGCSVLAGATA